MTMKKFELEKRKGLKLNNQLKASGAPDRFAAGSDMLDKREQRRRDQAAGLVPFACKLPADLVKRLQERAIAHPEGVNGLVAELLDAALKTA